MRKTIFTFMLGMFIVFLSPYALSNHGEEKDEKKDTIVAKANPVQPDTNVIAFFVDNLYVGYVTS